VSLRPLPFNIDKTGNKTYNASMKFPTQNIRPTKQTCEVTPQVLLASKIREALLATKATITPPPPLILKNKLMNPKKQLKTMT